jgi:hypothetical protein
MPLRNWELTKPLRVPVSFALNDWCIFAGISIPGEGGRGIKFDTRASK